MKNGDLAEGLGLRQGQTRTENVTIDIDQGLDPASAAAHQNVAQVGHLQGIASAQKSDDM